MLPSEVSEKLVVPKILYLKWWLADQSNEKMKLDWLLRSASQQNKVVLIFKKQFPGLCKYKYY